jgi:hypothetical protein
MNTQEYSECLWFANAQYSKDEVQQLVNFVDKESDTVNVSHRRQYGLQLLGYPGTETRTKSGAVDTQWVYLDLSQVGGAEFLTARHLSEVLDVFTEAGGAVMGGSLKTHLLRNKYARLLSELSNSNEVMFANGGALLLNISAFYNSFYHLVPAVLSIDKGSFDGFPSDMSPETRRQLQCTFRFLVYV